MESSRRDLLNDVAEHGSILKNNQNTNHPRFGFIPKTGIAFPKTGFCFCVPPRINLSSSGWGAFDSAKNRKRQSVTAKREKSQTPKFV